jgi:DNA ligase-1
LFVTQDEQLALRLVLSTPNAAVAKPEQVPPDPDLAQPAQEHLRGAEPGPSSSNPAAFAEFATTCSRIAADPRKLEKIRLVSEYVRQLSGGDAARAATWFTGRPFPSSQNKVLQLGWAILRDALCQVSGVNEPEFHQVYLKHSDLGETAAEVLQNRPAGRGLALGEVDELFQQLQAARGPLAKTPRLKAALARCSSLEAKYLVKIITGDLRIGLKEGLVEEALAKAFGQSPEAVRKANLLLGDIGETAKLASENRLDAATLVPFRPVKFMLASPEQTAADIWERMQGVPKPPRDPENTGSDNEIQPAPVPRSSAAPAPGSDAPVADRSPGSRVWLEDKYDGIRCQLHRARKRVELYSRDLKAITATFPELVRAAANLRADVILDGEIVAMRGEQVLPFAELQKRLGRKEGDLFMREEVPIQYVAFDLLWRDGQNLLDQPLRERRAALESLTAGLAGLRLARITPGASVREIDAAFEAARNRGNEGLVIKDPESTYAPGRRGLAWLKLKKAFATLDCVVVGAEYGHGKRKDVLSDYTFSVRDERTGQLKVIGKAYTGLTDEEIADLTRHFLKTAVRQHGRFFEVPPDTVLEIAFDRLQESPRHNSGLAMRFPRIVRIRADKNAAEIDTLQTARAIALQHGGTVAMTAARQRAVRK